MKVLVPYPDELVKLFKDILGDEAEVVQSERSAESMLEHGGDAEIIASVTVPGEYIRKASNLRLIQTFGAGIDRVDLAAVRERGDIIVCNNHVNSAEVAEYAIALLFAVAKNLIPSDRELRAGNWIHRWGGPVPNLEIRGKKALIIGLGHIGADIAKRLKSFEVKITAATHSGTSSNDDFVDQVISTDEVQSHVGDSDFVFLSLPLTDESAGLVNREFLSWMKPASILVNISRGQIIDELALYDALKEKRIHGAGIDVWWRYPTEWRGTAIPPADVPFHELDNIVISPHRAAYSEHIERELFLFAGQNIFRFIRGETPLNIIDIERGY
ncbi:MAG: 2-hydroxyacid dehydrogenase [Candidatus Thorarchaeota archaeon]|jgi:phosphoglycerate dehydrogenase-like enzyme